MTRTPLTGAARNAQTRRVLLDTAREAITDSHPDDVAALLERAYAKSTPAQRAALQRECAERESDRMWAELDDDASHAAECARYDAAAYDLGEDEWADLPVMGA